MHYIKISNLQLKSQKNKQVCFQIMFHKNFDEAKKSGLNFIRFCLKKIILQK